MVRQVERERRNLHIYFTWPGPPGPIGPPGTITVLLQGIDTGTVLRVLDSTVCVCDLLFRQHLQILFLQQ